MVKVEYTEADISANTEIKGKILICGKGDPNPLIVLATSNADNYGEFSGVTLVADAMSFGRHDTDWDINQFEEFKGTVTLTQNKN